MKMNEKTAERQSDFSSVILESQNGTGHRELDCTAF